MSLQSEYSKILANSQTHEQSKHEGEKYPCDYQATYVTIKQLKEDTLPLINSHNIKARPIPVTHVTIGQLHTDP